jgi:hypothetical protein
VKKSNNQAFDSAVAYATATGRSSSVRSVKARLFGIGKPVGHSAERTASATALPERTH